MLVAMFATNDLNDFCDTLRGALELDSVMQSKAAIQIVTTVYHWLGLKIKDFLQMGMSLEEI